MEHVFYAFTIIVLLFEIGNLFSPSRIRNVIKIGDDVKKGRLVSDEDGRKVIVFGCFGAVYVLWTITGLFSSQYGFFLVLLVLAFFTGVIKKLVPYKGYTLVIVIDSLLTIGLLIALIIDKYHINLI